MDSSLNRSGASRADPGILPRAFYDRPVLEVAPELLGMRLVRVLEDGRRLDGRIVEVEAYDGARDKACHAARGLTRRTAPMFEDPGHAYVYFIYGMHCCLNVVTGPPGYPAAVLIRALEPIAGLEWMKPGLAAPAAGASTLKPSTAASGPGRLTRAFHIGLSLNRADLCSAGALSIHGDEPVPGKRIVRGPRIGVEYAGRWADRPWRFGVRDHPALSRPFRARKDPRQSDRMKP